MSREWWAPQSRQFNSALRACKNGLVGIGVAAVALGLIVVFGGAK